MDFSRLGIIGSQSLTGKQVKFTALGKKFSGCTRTINWGGGGGGRWLVR